MKSKNRLCLIVLLTILTVSVDGTSQAKGNPDWIQEKLDFFVSECADHWDEYHVYPSCMAMIAAQESLFGTAGRSNNLWGLCAGRASYGSLEEGCHAFMECVNNDWYHGANRKNSGDEQLAQLLNHGYCQPPGNYYSCAMRLKSMFNLGELDSQMFKIIKKRKRKEEKRKRLKRQAKGFIPVYEDEIDNGVIYADPEYIRGGVVMIGFHLYDVKSQKGLKNRILTNNETMVRWHSDIYFDVVNEKAKG